MFGYVRPDAEELRVRDYSYYRAVYCGLCRAMAKEISPLLSFSLRYDFVLLVMARMLLTEEQGAVGRERCPFHPLKKRPVLLPCEALSYTARCSAILGYDVVCDNIDDERGMKRFLYRCIRPMFGIFRKKARKRGEGNTAVPESVIEAALDAQKCLEIAGEASPDAAAEPFGELLSAVFSAGLDGEASRIAASVGRHVGRYIYLCDALDDAAEDETEGSYNPLLRAAEQAGQTRDQWLSENRERLYCAMRLEAGSAYRALALVEHAEAHPAWACIENILTRGLEPERALKESRKDRNNEKKMRKSIHDGSV